MNVATASIVRNPPRVNKYLQKQTSYEINEHPHHPRLSHITFNRFVVEEFLEAHRSVDVQNLEYVPFMRFSLAKSLNDLAGGMLGQVLRAMVADRDTGGFTIGVEGVTTDPTDFVKFSTAVSHIVGPSNFDAMSGTFYARFVVKDTDSSDSYLRQAYRLFTLHTDGTFVEDATDWLLMMKFAEHCAVGGESRICHLDDWQDLERFTTHPLAGHKFTYLSPPSKNASLTVQRETFFWRDGRPCVCFIDQFVQPTSLLEAQYLKDLSDSLEASPATVALPLPVGDLIVLNNLFWLHGRAPFQKSDALHRELLRIRGSFST